MKNPFSQSEKILTSPVKSDKEINKKISGDFARDYACLKDTLINCNDVLFRSFLLSKREAVLVFCDGLCNSHMINECILKPLARFKICTFSETELIRSITEKTYCGAEVKTVENINDVFSLLFSGFCILITDKMPVALAFSVQSFEKRSVTEPYTEVSEKGAMESFVENLTDNKALLRRRLKNTSLKYEEMTLGVSSNTKVCICYLDDRVNKDTVNRIKNNLKNAKIDCLVSVDYLSSFITEKTPSFFTCVGRTERPDTLCAKLSEGRVGVIADGSPFALFVPFLFTENFQTPDDYSFRPYYSLFIRCLRVLCFFLSTLLPGLYVAVCVYHQEILSQALLVEIAVQENVTPFSITTEALAVHVMYEIVREAGLRMPKQVGHAVSIVGALVIGEAAVSAGIIAAPMVIIVALTAIGSFVVSPLYESVSVLRLVFIIIGGMTGLFGIMLFFGITVINICALKSENVPYSATLISSNIGSLRDVIFRFGWKKLGKRRLDINKLEK